MSGPMALEGMS